ncbi:hypothetical protein LTR53_010772 [Teratosphaeriaceae sp. CCFEE 6253]|nr:hypothetical protein LTR53_010772 [Teratosphaeriaceae sp. CCFEE 6253]
MAGTSTQQAQDANLVTAMPVKTGAQAYRLEIDEFIQDNAVTNLFLLALNAMYKHSLYNDNGSINWWSYYSLGAHSYTDPAWQKTYLDACDRFKLPYWDVCMPRNKTSDGATAKVKAANGNIWRWGFPKIFNSPSRSKHGGRDSRKLIDWNDAGLGWVQQSNGQWKFDASRFLTDHTARTPTVASGGESDYAFLEEAIQLQTQVMATNIWHLLNPEEVGVNLQTRERVFINQDKPWSVFASHAASRREFAAQSLEGWHDNIHNLVGSGKGKSGAMSDPSVAAFEPVFWFHHNNIDRLFAIFQALYPEKYVDPGHAHKGDTDGNQNPVVLGDDQLYPFRAKSSGTCFTSNDNIVKDWTGTGYAVPGFAKLEQAGIDQIAVYLRDTYYWATDAAEPPKTLSWPKDLSHVEALTGKPERSTAPATVAIKAMSMTAGKPTLVARSLPLAHKQAVHDTAIDGAISLASVQQVIAQLPTGAAQPPTPTHPDTPAKMRTWNINLRVKKYAFNGSFNIHFFIGPVDDAKSERFMTRMNEVGFSGVFASPKGSACTNCKNNAAMVYEDTVPLTSKLTEYLSASPGAVAFLPDGRTLQSLEVNDVVPFLKDNLSWKLVDTAGALLRGVEHSGLEVKVTDRLFTPPSAADPLGVHELSQVHAEITAGKVGGFNG